MTFFCFSSDLLLYWKNGNQAGRIKKWISGFSSCFLNFYDLNRRTFFHLLFTHIYIYETEYYLFCYLGWNLYFLAQFFFSYFSKFSQTVQNLSSSQNEITFSDIKENVRNVREEIAVLTLLTDTDGGHSNLIFGRSYWYDWLSFVSFIILILIFTHFCYFCYKYFCNDSNEFNFLFDLPIFYDLILLFSYSYIEDGYGQQEDCIRRINIIITRMFLRVRKKKVLSYGTYR